MEPVQRRENSEIIKQRRRLLLIAGILLLIAVIYFSGILSGSSDNATSTSGVSSDFKFDDADFSLTFMEPWVKLKTEELDELGNAFESAIKRTEPEALMGIQVREITDGKTDLKDLEKTLDKVMEDRFQNFESKGAKIKKINGQDVLKYEYQFDASNGDEVAQQQYIAIENDFAYYMVFNVKQADLPELDKEFEEIMSSLTFK